MATLITFLPGTTIKSADMNTNLAALNTGLTTLTANDAGTIRNIQLFEGTTDPTTLSGVTVNEGDLWADG